MIDDETELLIKSFEKLRLKAYQGAADQPGVYTIGWGHVITGHEDPDIFKPGNMMKDVVITAEQAETLFQQDLQTFISGVSMRLNPDKKKALTDDQFGALVSFAYNIGLGNFGISAVRATINNGDPRDAFHGFKSFVKSNGQVQNGLIRRRAAESALYQSDSESLNLFMNNSDPKTIKAAAIYLDLEV